MLEFFLLCCSYSVSFAFLIDYVSESFKDSGNGNLLRKFNTLNIIKEVFQPAELSI